MYWLCAYCTSLYIALLSSPHLGEQSFASSELHYQELRTTVCLSFCLSLSLSLCMCMFVCVCVVQEESLRKGTRFAGLSESWEIRSALQNPQKLRAKLKMNHSVVIGMNYYAHGKSVGDMLWPWKSDVVHQRWLMPNRVLKSCQWVSNQTFLLYSLGPRLYSPSVKATTKQFFTEPLVFTLFGNRWVLVGNLL